MGHRRHQDIPVVLEADEAAIEEMVGIGREEQAILSIEALLVARVPPRLAVACTQMLFARDARDAARALDPHHVRLERPLPAPRKDDGLALGRPPSGCRE